MTIRPLSLVNLRYCWVVVLLCLPGLMTAQIEKPIGINISAVHDYSTEFVFPDAFKQCRTWIPFNADGSGPWDTGVQVPLDDRGYPLEIPYDDGIHPPQGLRALMLWDIGSARPAGLYRLIVEGTGQVRLRFGAAGTYDCPVDTLVSVDDNLALEILASNAGDPIRNIQFIYPPYINDFTDRTFTDAFLDFLEDFQLIRFMDWTRTNNSAVQSWDQRGKQDYYTQTQAAGVAWEYVIELCNLTEKDAWINIPHRADDDYIIQLATLLHEQLHPERKIYLEYSNEVWNSIFAQHASAAEMAADLGYTGQQWERAWKYTAKRSADLFHLFETVFDDNSRLIKVIPSQSANSWLSNQIISYFQDPFYNPSQVDADALGIAPYFGYSVANDIVAEGLVASISIEEIVGRMLDAQEASFEHIDAQKGVADDYSFALMAYEAGQHLVGNGGNENNDALTAKLIAANHHPDLQAAYCQYLDYWYEHAGSLLVHFSSHGTYSKWGSWGVKETMDDFDNPKYRALEQCIFSFNDVGTSTTEVSGISFSVYPNPSQDGAFTVKGTFDIQTVQLTDLLGRAVDVQWGREAPDQIQLQIKSKGVYLLVIDGKTRLIMYP